MYVMILIAIIFFVLLFGPILFALLYYKVKKGDVLHINQARVRDARYFGKSFASLIETRLSETSDETIRLSKKEKFIDSDKNILTEKKYSDVIIGQELEIKHNVDHAVFEKEIYSANNVYIEGSNVKIRALYGRLGIVLGKSMNVVRWVDAGQVLVVHDQTSLGISASAGKTLIIDGSVSFRRLYAPEIRIGQNPNSKKQAMDGKDQRVLYLVTKNDMERNTKTISNDTIAQDGIAACSILSKDNVTVLENIIIQGNIRSHKGVRLCDGSAVCGNIFAENEIRIGKNCVVLGNIFTQENIYIEEGSVIGQKGSICSIISRENIRIEKDCFVFGYISCEKQGRVDAIESGEDEIDLAALEIQEQVLKDVTFPNVHEYEKLDAQGFRNNPEIHRVIVPEGAKDIPRSMFFACINLVSIRLPSSLTNIADFAFANCDSFVDLTGLRNTHIKTIGTSAFENCKMLAKIELPNTLCTLEGAAFAGCSNLKTIHFERNSSLKRIGAHCFHGCTKLTRINLPTSVETIEVSAFIDCENLKEIYLPQRCEKEPGIQSIDQTKVKIKFIPDQTSDNLGYTVGGY